MNVFDEFALIISQLEQQRIRYALIGGVAIAFYVEPRFTQDIDLLVRREDYELLHDVLLASNYSESTQPWNFQATPLILHRFLKVIDNDSMMIDVLVSGDPSFDEMISNAIVLAGGIGTARVAQKKDLIELKRRRNSLQDQADIERLENENT